MIHTLDATQQHWTTCGRQPVNVRAAGDEIVSVEAFSRLPLSAQCGRCRYPGDPTKPLASASPAEILAVSLFGPVWANVDFDPLLAEMLASYVAGEADQIGPILDLAERRSYQTGNAVWPVERREWQERDAHGTGDNPHVWLTFVSGVDLSGVPRVAVVGVDDRRCPCGLFENEAPSGLRGRIRDRVRSLRQGLAPPRAERLAVMIDEAERATSYNFRALEVDPAGAESLFVDMAACSVLLLIAVQDGVPIEVIQHLRDRHDFFHRTLRRVRNERRGQLTGHRADAVFIDDPDETAAEDPTTISGAIGY